MLFYLTQKRIGAKPVTAAPVCSSPNMRGGGVLAFNLAVFAWFWLIAES
jgi:hypothetical protein